MNQPTATPQKQQPTEAVKAAPGSHAAPDAKHADNDAKNKNASAKPAGQGAFVKKA